MSTMNHALRLMALVAAAIAVVVFAPATALSQRPGDIPGRCADPPSARTSEIGCYLLSNEQVVALPRVPLYWHLYSYSTKAAASAAGAVGSGNQIGPSAVVEAFGKVWRFTLAAQTWTPASGERAGVVGPLVVPDAAAYRIRYMEGTFPPGEGMLTTVHRHAGPEAWFVLSGAQCLRTPGDTMVLRAGEGGTVPPGPSMVLTSIGPDVRRSFVLVVHDAAQPWLTNTSEWTPTTVCPDR